MDDAVRAELDRIHDEDNRQNHRIEDLEESVKSFQEIAMSVQRLAINMENMIVEQKKQGEKLARIEAEPAERWNSARRTAFTTIISVIAGAMATGLIVFVAQNIGG